MVFCTGVRPGGVVERMRQETCLLPVLGLGEPAEMFPLNPVAAIEVHIAWLLSLAVEDELIRLYGRVVRFARRMLDWQVFTKKVARIVDCGVFLLDALVAGEGCELGTEDEVAAV